MSEQPTQFPQGCLLLIRHGEAGHNVKGTYNSQIGHPAYTVERLTDAGRSQARATANALKEKGVSGENVYRVLVSPMPRTLETASLLCEVLNIPAHRQLIVDELIESGVGDREGHLYSRYDDRDFWFPENPEAFGGETREQVKQRVSSALKQALDDQSCDFSRQFTLIVSHGVAVYLMLEALGEEGAKLPPAGYKVIYNPAL